MLAEGQESKAAPTNLVTKNRTPETLRVGIASLPMVAALRTNSFSPLKYFAELAAGFPFLLAGNEFTCIISSGTGSLTQSRRALFLAVLYSNYY